ncbi:MULTISPECIES: hypothetical protein [unclassified Nonomuraea]|uniref:hypothetical protein n=1 Tax=unclassified Nonomuraea TaxID=2593643 RepID=UPI00191C5F08|nr:MULTISPECIES: hypothetical protein [unclassified Nonomuraea]
MTYDADLSAERGLIEALHVSAPSGAHADKLMLFGQFVGSWDIEWSGTALDGGTARAKGELHFGWVLGGRAVQDTWIMPGRNEVAAPNIRAFQGTTVRFYDPDLDAWRSTWIEPINARVRRFIGRPVDGDIVLLSDEDEPWLRWRFTEITPSSARWLGETSHDKGATWVLDEEMILTRRPS